MPDIKEAIILDFQEFRLNNFNICIIDILRLLLLIWTFAFCILFQQNLKLHKYNLAQMQEKCVVSFFPLFLEVLKFHKNFEARFCVSWHWQLKCHVHQQCSFLRRRNRSSFEYRRPPSSCQVFLFLHTYAECFPSFVSSLLRNSEDTFDVVSQVFVPYTMKWISGVVLLLYIFLPYKEAIIDCYSHDADLPHWACYIHTTVFSG